MNDMIPYKYRRKNQNGEGPNHHLVPVENVLHLSFSQFRLHLQLVCAKTPRQDYRRAPSSQNRESVQMEIREWMKL